jgi:hypothetical protein
LGELEVDELIAGVGRRLAGQREANLEGGFTGTGLDADVALMGAHDALHDIQAQARSLSHWLGSEKRLENAVPDFGGDARAVISEFHEDVVGL